MQISAILLSVSVLLLVSFFAGQFRAERQVSERGLSYLHSLPFYYGLLTALWTALPAILLLLIWFLAQNSIIETLVYSRVPEDFKFGDVGEKALILNQVYNIAYGTSLNGHAPPELMLAAEYLKKLETQGRWVTAALVWSSMSVVFFAVVSRNSLNLRARTIIESFFQCLFFISAFVAVLITGGILFSVLFEALRFFEAVPLGEFLFGKHWEPQMPFHDEQELGQASFGALPLFTGTLMIASIALMVAVPVGLMSAIYLSEYCGRTTRLWVKPMLEVLAGIPTVVYGFFVLLVVAPLVQSAVHWLSGGNLEASPQSALAVGLVLGVMVIPFISSLADDAIVSVPQSLRDGALALGATRAEVVKHVLIPAAMPGILSGVLLAASRALGETMIVVMAAGITANFTLNPLQTVTTVTVQIKTLLDGDHSFDSPETLAAFALGLTLFVVTLSFNFVAIRVAKKFDERYG